MTQPTAHQFVTALSYGDAIGDYTLEIQRILRARGYRSEIFAEVVHPQMVHHVRSLYDYEREESDDTLMLIHFSIGSDLGYMVPYLRGKKMLIYHNITPYDWFIDINTVLAFQCLIGRKQLQRLKRFCAVGMADSEYNRQELELLGYQHTGVLPIRLNFDKFDGAGDPLTRELYDDHRTNFIVVGRAIPNKKLEDCLKAFAYYQKYINPRSRLIFAGLWNGFESYYFGLRAMATRLQLQEAVFTGHIRFDELLALYRLADALIIMSEHEGFCVPLMEAFYMKVPVLAWDACAIPYTSGEGAMLVQDRKNHAAIAEMMHRMATDEQLRRQVIEAQQRQLKKSQAFPFESTLLESLELLKRTQSEYLPIDQRETSTIPSVHASSPVSPGIA